MSKSGKTKNVAQESTAECHSCSCILMSFVIYFETSISSGLMDHLARMQTLPTFYWTRAQHQSIYLFYIIKRQKTANDIICTSVLLLIVNRTNQTARITTTDSERFTVKHISVDWMDKDFEVLKSHSISLVDAFLFKLSHGCIKQDFHGEMCSRLNLRLIGFSEIS